MTSAKEINLSRINKLIHLGLLILVILVPFHAFFKTWFTSLITASTIDFLSPGSFIIGAWKEILIALLFIIVIVKSIIAKELPFKIKYIDLLVLAFIALAVIYGIFSEGPLTQRIFGLKTDGEFLVLYLIVRSVPWKVENILKILKALLISSSIVVIFGLLLVYLLPDNFLLYFGYTPYISSYVDYKPLPIYHGLGETLETYRLASTLSGPNQFGSYIILIISITISLFLISWKQKELKSILFNPWVLSFFALFSLVALYNTFSRSAWIGLAISLLVLFILKLPNWKKRFFALLGLLLMLIITAAGFLTIQPDQFSKYILHGSSTAAHLERMQEGISTVIAHPLGLGLGQAGPVQRRFEGEEEAIISENWYLQIGEELGIAGAILFISILVILVMTFYKAYQKEKEPVLKSLHLGVLLGLVGFGTTALFLHSFEDSTTSLTLFLLSGIVVTRETDLHTITDRLLTPALKFFSKK